MAIKQYIEGIGRRKTASARVRLTPAKETTIVVNEKPMAEYFKAAGQQQAILGVLGAEGAGGVGVVEHLGRAAEVAGLADVFCLSHKNGVAVGALDFSLRGIDGGGPLAELGEHLV